MLSSQARRVRFSTASASGTVVVSVDSLFWVGVVSDIGLDLPEKGHVRVFQHAGTPFIRERSAPKDPSFLTYGFNLYTNKARYGFQTPCEWNIGVEKESLYCFNQTGG